MEPQAIDLLISRQDAATKLSLCCQVSPARHTVHCVPPPCTSSWSLHPPWEGAVVWPQLCVSSRRSLLGEAKGRVMAALLCYLFFYQLQRRLPRHITITTCDLWHWAVDKWMMQIWNVSEDASEELQTSTISIWSCACVSEALSNPGI